MKHGVIRRTFRRGIRSAVGLALFAGFLFFPPLLFWVIFAPAHAVEWWQWLGLILSAPCAYLASK